MSDRKNDNQRNFNRNQAPQRNRNSRPGYKRNPAPDRASRRPRSGGLVRAKILDYKPGKEFGKLVPLEGEFKLTQVVFYKNAIDTRVEHHIYKDQEVLVLLQKENDNIEVKKIEFNIDYRPIPGEEKIKEKADEKPTKQVESKATSISQDDKVNKKDFIQEKKPKEFSKQREKLNQEKTQSNFKPQGQVKRERHPPSIQQDKIDTVKSHESVMHKDLKTTQKTKETTISSEQTVSEKPKKERKQKPKETNPILSPLNEIESLNEKSLLENEIKETPKKEKRQKKTEKLKSDGKTAQKQDLEEENLTTQTEIIKSEIEPNSKTLDSLESMVVNEKEINSSNAFTIENPVVNESKGKPTSEDDFDINDLDSLVNQVASAENKENIKNMSEEEISTDGLTSEDDITSLTKNLDQSDTVSKTNPEVTDVTDLDELVSALGSSDSMDEDELAKLMSKVSEKDAEQSLPKENELDSKYQKGFTPKDKISAKKLQKSVKKDGPSEEPSEHKPGKSLKEELAEENREESLLEKLVGKIAIEIDEEDEEEFEGEEDSSTSGVAHFKEENILSDSNANDSKISDKGEEEVEEDNEENKDLNLENDEKSDETIDQDLANRSEEEEELFDNSDEDEQSENESDDNSDAEEEFFDYSEEDEKSEEDSENDDDNKDED